MANETLLVISGPGVPPWSARGLRQTLEPIDAIKGATVLRRTVNGTLIDLSPPQMRKYKSVVSCTDQRPPAFDGLWPGMQVTVDCVYELGYLTEGGTPGRPVVDGSSYVEGDFTYYRPRLTMRIADLKPDVAEYDASVSWQIDLEEV